MAADGERGRLWFWDEGQNRHRFFASRPQPTRVHIAAGTVVQTKTGAGSVKSGAVVQSAVGPRPRKAAPAPPACKGELADVRILALRPDWTPDELKACYRRLAFLFHPDRGGDASAFAAVTEAYDRLRALC